MNHTLSYIRCSLARYNDHFIQPHHAKELHAAYAGDKAVSTAEAKREMFIRSHMSLACQSSLAELHHG